MESNLIVTDLDDVEQLKRKIMQIKLDIARKQRKLLKCEKAAKNRRNSSDVECGRDRCDITKSPELRNRKEEQDERKTKNTKQEVKEEEKNARSTTMLAGFPLYFSETGQELNEKQSRDQSRSPTMSSENLTDGERFELSSLEVVERSRPDRNLEELTENITNVALYVSDKQSIRTETFSSTKKRSSVESLPSRRSVRLSRRAQSIRSGEFLSTRSVCEGSKEDDAKRDATTSNGRRLFPAVFPSRLTNVSSDFVLPDSQYAALKLKVRKTKELLCFREDDDDGRSSHGTRNEDVDSSNDFPPRFNVPDRKPTLNYRSISSERKPVLAVHCSHLRSSYDPIPICVVVQSGTITTWTCKSKNWTLLNECRSDLRDCRKSNIHRLETEFVVGTVCIGRTTIWIHTCDGERRVTLKEFHLSFVSDVDESNVLSCTVGIDALFVASSVDDSNKSRVKKYILSPNLKDVVEETDFKEVGDRLNSLLCIDGLESALLGTSCTKLYVWNVDGKIVKAIAPQGEQFDCLTCTLCVAQKGLLFLGVVPTDLKCDFLIVAVNPITSTWTKIKHFSMDDDRIVRRTKCRTDRNRNKLRDLRCEGQFLLASDGEDGIWHLETGKLLAFVDGRSVNYATVYRRNASSDFEIVIANDRGLIASYSLAT